MNKPTTDNRQPTTWVQIGFLSLLFVVFGWSLIDVSHTLAQEEECVPKVGGGGTEYCLLEPDVPHIDRGDGKTDSATFLVGLFKLMIGLAGVMAVIMIIYGGVIKMSSDAVSGQSKANEIISNAIWGLLFAIAAWLILYTINPRLVEIKFDIKPVETTNATVPGAPGLRPGDTAPPPNEGGRTTPLPGYTLTPEQVAQDRAIETRLGQNNPPVKIHNDPCVTGNTKGCTNVVGLSDSAITGVMILASTCQARVGSDCKVLITGGSEGGHVTHGPGLAQVDLNKNTSINKYIKENGASSTVNCGVKSAAKYSLGGAIYVDEGSHWHVCY